MEQEFPDPLSPIRHIYIYIYTSSTFGFSKKGFYQCVNLSNDEISEQRWGRAKDHQAESGKKWTHKGNFGGLQLDPFVGLQCFLPGPFWVSLVCPECTGIKESNGGREGKGREWKWKWKVKGRGRQGEGEVNGMEGKTEAGQTKPTL